MPSVKQQKTGRFYVLIITFNASELLGSTTNKRTR